jgi:MFS family permease
VLSCEVLRELQRKRPLLGLSLQHGYPRVLVGPLVALFSVAPILLALPVGRLADRLGYHVPNCIAVALTLSGGLCALIRGEKDSTDTDSERGEWNLRLLEADTETKLRVRVSDAASCE